MEEIQDILEEIENTEVEEVDEPTVENIEVVEETIEEVEPIEEKKKKKKKGLKGIFSSITDIEESLADKYSIHDFDNFPYEHQIYIRLLNQTYKGKGERKKQLGDWKYIKEFSTKELSLYINEEEKKGVVSIKGTTTYEELRADLFIALGINKDVFRKTYKDLRTIKDAYYDYDLIYTGHSLGGTKVMGFANEEFGINGFAFNPYIPKLSNFLLNMILQTPGITKYSILGDMLSNNMFDLKEETVKVLYGPISKGILNKHSLVSFRQL